jgi:hypothetical protein
LPLYVRITHHICLDRPLDDLVLRDVVDECGHDLLFALEDVNEQFVLRYEACIHHGIGKVIDWANVVLQSKTITDAEVPSLFQGVEREDIELAIQKIGHGKVFLSSLTLDDF